MAGRQLGALGAPPARRRLAGRHAGGVVSRAGWPDQLASDHRVARWPRPALLHAGRPTVVTVGVGATPVACRRSGYPQPAKGLHGRHAVQP